MRLMWNTTHTCSCAHAFTSTSSYTHVSLSGTRRQCGSWGEDLWNCSFNPTHVHTQFRSTQTHSFVPRLLMFFNIALRPWSVWWYDHLWFEAWYPTQFGMWPKQCPCTLRGHRYTTTSDSVTRLTRLHIHWKHGKVGVRGYVYTHTHNVLSVSSTLMWEGN